MSAHMSAGGRSLLVGPVAADNSAAQPPAAGEAFGSLLAGALPQRPDATPAKDGRNLPDGPGALDGPTPTRGRARHGSTTLTAAMQDPAAPAPADGALSKTPTAAQLVSVPLVLRPDLKPSPAAPASSGAVSALGSTASSAPGGLATAPGTTGPAAGAPADPASTGNRNVRPGPAQPLAAAKAAPEAEAPRGVRANRPTSAPAPSGTPAHPTPEAAAAVTPQLTPSPSPATSVSAPSSVAAASVPAAQPALETALAHVRTRPSGTHELTVELHPADLGAVRVIARLSGDQLDVTVLCADHAAQQAVAAAVPTLHDRLSELKHVDITDFGGPSNQPAGSFGDTSHGRPQGGGDRHPTVVQDEPADRRTNNEGPVKQTRRAAGADGRLDRRI